MIKSAQNIPYLDIFKKAFDITWKNKSLWWFGLFLALGGGMGNINFPIDEKNKFGSEEVSRFISSHWQFVIAGAVILVLLCLLFMVLSVIARAGAIMSLEKILKGKPFEFRSGMREGKKYFGKLFILYVILGALMIASLIILGVPVIFLFLAKSYILGIILSVLAVLIFIPIVVLATYMKTYGEIYIVSGKLASIGAIETAYDLFRKNILTSIIMGLLFIPVGMIMMVGILIAIAPLAVLIFVFAMLGPVGITVAVILGLIGLAGILFVQSIFQVFHQTAWLLFFREIATPLEEEKIEEPVAEVKKEILPTVDPVKTVEIEK